MIPRFEIFLDKKKQWRFRLKARNGKIIAVSEAYVTKRSAEIGIEAVQDCAPDAIILYKD